MDIKVKNSEGEFVSLHEPETEVIEAEKVIEEPEKVVSEEVVSEKPIEEIKEVIEEKPVEVKNEFPSDRFGGKFQSWDDIEKALSEPKFSDDFIKKVVETYNNKGTLKDFFEAHSVDWDKTDDVGVLKRNFFDENSDLDPKITEKLWNKKLREYNVDPELATEEELEENLALLARDANKVRKTYKEKQQQYLEPERKKVNPEEETKKIRAVVEMQPETKSLRDGKKVVFEIEGEPFNYVLDDVDPVVESLVDENVFRSLFIDNGKVNIDKWAKTFAFGKNPDQMIKSFVDYGKTLARAEYEQELGIAKVPSQQPKEAKTGDFQRDLAKAFAEKGKIVKY